MFPSSPRGPRHLLATLAGLALIGLILLLPDLTQLADTGRDAVTAFRGRIEIIQPAPSDPDLPPVPIAKVLALDGPQAGQTIEAYLSGPGGSQSVANYQPGDEVVVTITQSPDGSAPFVSVADRWRLPSLQLLGLLFAAVVVLVGGWRGARALVALGLTIAIILKFLLPLIINGVSPIPVAVVAASAVTVATILLTEGWHRSSLAAILGTTGALALTGLLGALVTNVMGFTYTAGSDLAFMSTQGGAGLDLRGLLLAAFILGAAGVLDDATVTQAVLVDELADKGQLGGRDLFWSAMGVGRSHIGATINTLFLAYVAVSLPLMVVLIVSRQPTDLVLNDETIATEVVRTLVGSIGIVAAVPFTTAVAAMLAATSSSVARAGMPDRRPAAVAAIGLAIVGLLAATIFLPLTSGATTPLAQPVFDPDASFLAGVSDSEEPASREPTQSDGATPPAEPVLVDLGEPLPLIEGGESVGTVTVVRWALKPESAPRTGERFRAVLRYEATGPLDLGAGLWELLLDDGTEVPLTATDPADLDGSLTPGETREVTLVGDLRNGDGGTFLVYLDQTSGAFWFAVPID